MLSPGVRLEEDAEVTESILMDNVRVGPGARLSKTIVDENVELPAGYVIGLDRSADEKKFVVSDNGVTVVPAGVVFD